MITNTDPDQIFRIGIAMAGAVSAGAYTAGVIDYLLETLQRWETAKQQNRKLGPEHPDYRQDIPMHDVVLEVIGGASAGGMTAAITSLALFEGITPVNDDNPAKQGNKLYEAWVNLNDSEAITLQQMLENDDIVDNKVPSLLNSKPIDMIADRAKEVRIERDIYAENWPGYISKDLELILTICSLRGIPIEIDFGPGDLQDTAGGKESPPSEKAAHKMHLHKGIAHFSINPTRAQLDHLLRLNPRIADDRTAVIEAAKATGAFPIGLRPRKFSHISHTYLRAQVQRMFGRELNIRWSSIPKPFNFMAVDGGTINNEPFEEVLKVLEEKYQSEHPAVQATDSKSSFKNYAIIMIDPFPNFEEKNGEEEYVEPESIQQAAPRILSAIRRQAMIKESELSRGFTGDHSRAMVFPVRRETVIQDGETIKRRTPYAIACGALDGFGGFFSRNFREHDFLLGRKNCQAFLRKHFIVREEQVFRKEETGEEHIACPAFCDWKPGNPIYERFHYVKHEHPCFPIIPDLRVSNARSENPAENGALPAPDYPKISIEALQQLKHPMRRRVRKVMLSMIKGSFSGSKKEEVRSEQEQQEAALQDEVRRTVNRYLGDSPFYRILLILAFFLLMIPVVIISPFLLILGLLGFHVLVNRITKQIFKSIVKDFKKRGLLNT